MTPFAGNFNGAVAAARRAAAEAAREKARAEEAAFRAAREKARADEAASRAAREKARAEDAASRADKAASRAAREVAKVGGTLARERELVLDIVALRFGPEVARRVRPVLEAMDGPDRVYDVRSRALASSSAEDLLHGLGLSDGRSP